MYRTGVIISRSLYITPFCTAAYIVNFLWCRAVNILQFFFWLDVFIKRNKNRLLYWNRKKGQISCGLRCRAVFIRRKLSEPQNPWFIIKSGFKSRAGYDGARTVIVFLSERGHYITLHPLGIFRCHWSLIFTFSFTFLLSYLLFFSYLERGGRLKILKFEIEIRIYLS